MHTGVRRATTTTADGTLLWSSISTPGDTLVEAAAPGFQTAAQLVVLDHRPAWPARPGLAASGVGEAVTVTGGDCRSSTRSPRSSATWSAGSEISQPAAGDPQLGRPAVHAARRAGRPLHRADRHDQRRPHRRRQHARQPLAAEQLPARRRGQQLDLHQRPGAVHAGVAAVDRRDRRVQGGHQPVRRRVRPRPGGAIVVTTKSGTNACQRHGLRLLPQRELRREAVLREARRTWKADQRPEAVRRQHRRTDRSRQCAFFFGDFESTRISQGVLRTGRVADARRARGVFFAGASRDPTHRAAVREQHDPGRAHRSRRARRSSALLPRAQHHRHNNFIRQPNVEDDGERYLLGPISSPTQNDNVFVRFIYTDRTRFVPGLLRRRRRRHVDVGVGTQLPEVHSPRSSAGRECSAAASSTSSASRGPQGHSDGQQDPFGNDGLGQIGFRGVPAQPGRRSAASSASTSRVTCGSARRTSCRSIQHTDQFAVPRHADVARAAITA